MSRMGSLAARRRAGIAPRAFDDVHPALRLLVEFPNGDEWLRDYTEAAVKQRREIPACFGGTEPPGWMAEHKTYREPGMPHTFWCKVKVGLEDEAKEALGATTS